jgi:hypothetical protein
MGLRKREPNSNTCHFLYESGECRHLVEVQDLTGQFCPTVDHLYIERGYCRCPQTQLDLWSKTPIEEACRE